MSGQEERPLKGIEIYEKCMKLPIQELVRLFVLGRLWLSDVPVGIDDRTIMLVNEDIKTMGEVLRKRGVDFR